MLSFEKKSFESCCQHIPPILSSLKFCHVIKGYLLTKQLFFLDWTKSKAFADHKLNTVKN